MFLFCFLNVFNVAKRVSATPCDSEEVDNAKDISMDGNRSISIRSSATRDASASLSDILNTVEELFSSSSPEVN